MQPMDLEQLQELEDTVRDAWQEAAHAKHDAATEHVIPDIRFSTPSENLTSLHGMQTQVIVSTHGSCRTYVQQAELRVRHKLSYAASLVNPTRKSLM